jgi:hypothetical protein
VAWTILFGAPAPAAAQVLKPWVPPAADSLIQWATEAKVRFQKNTGDSIGGENFRAYDLVGRMGRRLLRSLGRDNMRQALAIKPMLDSLGLDADIEVDPAMPFFALLMVRNPYRHSAKAIGFLYWYLENDLRMQGAQFNGGTKPAMRVWWTGNPDAPYSWGVMDRAPGPDPSLHFTLFRLHSQGRFWTLVQIEDTGLHLGPSGSISWVDMNGDDRFEAVAWVPAEQDSLFDQCEDCPKRLNELIFVERPDGLRLLDTRLVPSPYSTFTLFVHLLLGGNRAQAARLVKDPGLVQRALADGWATRKEWRTWLIEEAEPGQPWPLWLLVRFKGPKGDRRYRVDFEQSQGRWVIRDWADRQIVPTGAKRSSVRTVRLGAPADSGASHR